MSYSKDAVKEHIELEDICTLLEYFDAEPQVFSDYIIAKTICHNGDTHKLYYYNNTQLFKCYTGECGTFDVFELVQKIKGIEDLNKAVYFIVNFFNLTYKIEESDTDYTSEDWQIFSRYEKTHETSYEYQKLELPEYNENILRYYPKLEIADWSAEGINREVCDYMGICYDPVNCCILIPHKDEDDRLVGIRQRALVPEDEIYGKYRPWKTWDNKKNKPKLYNHPLAFNLYSSNSFWKNIEKVKTAVVFEGEKSVLKYISYFGLANDISCAVCGNSISKYQFQLLQEHGVSELIIAFDRDFEDDDVEGQREVERKLQRIYDKYNSLMNISFLYDSQKNMLPYKGSPIDNGKEAFMYLFRNRVIL